MIDATMDGRPPGTVSVVEPRYASDYPRSLSAHDIGLKDLVESAALLGTLPKVLLVTVSVADLQPMQVTISPEVEASLPQGGGTGARLVASLLLDSFLNVTLQSISRLVSERQVNRAKAPSRTGASDRGRRESARQRIPVGLCQVHLVGIAADDCGSGRTAGCRSTTRRAGPRPRP